MAICFVISFFPIFRLPFGGSITIGKMLPLVFFTYFYGVKSGVFAGVIYSILQMMIFPHIPPAKTPLAFVLAALLDYMIPYLSAGFTAVFKNNFLNKKMYFTISIILVYSVRFLCGTVSGIIVWGEYIPSEYNIWTYAVVYNLIYIVPETLISLLVCSILLKFLMFKKTNHTL